MTDAHGHVSCGDPAIREFLIGRDFVGVHPWEVMGNRRIVESSNRRICDESEDGDVVSSLRIRLESDPSLGIGEIGLDRLKDRNITPRMREVFEAQLKLALEFRRPVVLHGAKCWGQVVHTIQSMIRRFDDSTISRFLFHGFSRSDGLIPDIVALNGYISVGPAVLNDHAVNYRVLVKKIPLDRLLLETDRTLENAATCPSVRAVAAKVADLRGLALAELEAVTDRNADEFWYNTSK